MLTALFSQETGHFPVPKEGDLYKSVTISGHTFHLLYGYYEDFERQSKYNEPMPIYPDFIKHPQYTENGTPFATAMQDICACYDGAESGDSCSHCSHFQMCEELFGLCHCPKNKRTTDSTGGHIK